MDLSAWISIIAGLLSLTVSGIAIALSIYFYDRGKTAEKDVSNSLTEIRTQTEALQKLTGRWMDRLTKYVTEPKPTDAMIKEIVGIFVESGTFGFGAQSQAAPPTNEDLQAAREELVSGYIAAFYYSALGNIGLQSFLPPAADLTEDNVIKRAVDSSYADYQYFQRYLGSIPDWVNSNRLKHLYDETISLWGKYTRDSAMVYAKAAEQSASE